MLNDCFDVVDFEKKYTPHNLETKAKRSGQRSEGLTLFTMTARSNTIKAQSIAHTSDATSRFLAHLESRSDLADKTLEKNS